MTKALPALLVGGVVAAGIGWSVATHQIEIAKRDAQIHTQDSLIAVLRQHTVHVDSVYVTDTIRLTKWKTSYDTLRDTVLKHLTDTLKVVEYIHAADSTINACSQVVSTCQLKVAQRDSIILQQNAQLRLLRKPPRLFGLFPAPSRTLTFGLGAVAGYLLHR